MDREEILKRSRQEKQDVGLSEAENRGRKMGVGAFCIVFAVVEVFSLFCGETPALHAAATLFWAYCAAEAYPKYRFTRSKAYLAVAVAGSIAAAATFANFVVQALHGTTGGI